MANGNSLETDTKPITPAMMRILKIIAGGRQAQSDAWGYYLIILAAKATERGLVRTVKHRDHTQSYVLTKAGRDAIKETP